MLLNVWQAASLRVFALLFVAVVRLWHPAPDGVQLDEDARLGLVALFLVGNDVSVVVVCVALTQLRKGKRLVRLHLTGCCVWIAELLLPLSHVGVFVVVQELVGPRNIVGIEVALSLVLTRVSVGVTLSQHKHLRVDPSVGVPWPESHSWVHSNDRVLLQPSWSVMRLRQGGKEDVEAGDPEPGKEAVVDAVEDGDLEPGEGGAKSECIHSR